MLVKKNFSAVFFLQLAPCRRVRWRTEAVNVRLHFRGFHRLIAVSAWPGLPLSAGFPPPLAPTLRPAVLRTLYPPTLIRGRAAGLAPPALGAVEQSVTSRGRGSIRRGVWEILNLKAGQSVLSEAGEVGRLRRFSEVRPGRMAEEGAVAVCVRVRPLNNR